MIAYTVRDQALVWREEQGERQYRFITTLVKDDEDYQVLVTDVRYPLGGKVNGATPVFPEPLHFTAYELAKTEARAILDDYLKKGWID